MNYNGTLQIYLPSHWFFQSNNQNLTAFIVDMFHRIVPFAAAVVGMNVVLQNQSHDALLSSSSSISSEFLSPSSQTTPYMFDL